MTMQIVPASAQLSPRRTKEEIGYRVLDINRETVSRFSRTRVGESKIRGHYFVAGGVEAPADGGFIVWGVLKNGNVTDLAEGEIPPAPVDNGAQIAALLNALQKNVDRELGAVQTGLMQLQEQTASQAEV